nr:RNA-directed DNA polymerase, eukaryota [Tanacetum cinerariifolium]
EFFVTSKFPRGCNSSFIALIPKVKDAKVVKDFRPISLIGSMYKIFAKVLVNRLSIVIPNLISEVQSAFVSNRQILDGSFILNEFLSWCKYKNTKAFIFKVDFEKAFDLVRWDYLDDNLKAFGFGEKWRGWIDGCLKSAMGSILVNGSPTSEFEFQRGLKQCDHLSPFLFILIMESLHLSFSKVLGVGLFKGVSINGSLTLSHLFYDDDVVFIREWSESNIRTIVHVLKCFFLASGCSTFSTPFNYLGVKVGDIMSRGNSWAEVISKLSSRLSRWKLKTLSSGGRLTLIKSILTAIPLYHMSIFKAPICSLDKVATVTRTSPWLGILREVSSLNSKDIDLLNYARRKNNQRTLLVQTIRTLLVQFLMVAVVRRWWLMADEDEYGGEVEGDGGMEMAADVMVADKDGGDVVFE